MHTSAHDAPPGKHDNRPEATLPPHPLRVGFWSGYPNLNGRKSPYPTDECVNTSDGGNQTDRRAEVNQFLRGDQVLPG
jgi:hypothetical protein